jgi:hypothetical protein
MVDMEDPAPAPGSRVFVGRDREAAELLAGLEDAIGGRGRLFLIAGEAERHQGDPRRDRRRL